MKRLFGKACLSIRKPLHDYMHVRYRTQEIFGRGKFFSVQVKAILVRKNLANKLQSVHMLLYIFCASVNIGEENLVNT